MKCVIIIDEMLSPGTAANTAAALGLSLGNTVAGLIGPDTVDGDGKRHLGITAVPMPILASAADTLRTVYHEAMASEAGLTVLGFSETAQGCQHYSDYVHAMAGARSDELVLLGVCLYGPKKAVNRLSGQMRLYR